MTANADYPSPAGEPGRYYPTTESEDLDARGPQVRLALARVAAATDVLAGVVDGLEERLTRGGVLRPAEPAPSAASLQAANSPHQAPMAAELDDLAARTSGASCRLRTLLERLEV